MRNDFDQINPLSTVEDRSSQWPVTPIGNEWSRRYYDGPFHIFDAPADSPAISLVFVQTKNGNTGAHNPADLGGGPTDLHLLYEGLTRVAADGVLAGASSAGHNVFFTINHPELVALRAQLGLPSHLAQMVLSKAGNVDLSARLFTNPDVPVFVLAGPQCIGRVCEEVVRRPWITMIPTDDDLRSTFARLRNEFGIGRISAIGGRKAATSLVDAGLVQDIYLTTTAIEGGEPNTPWYVGDRKLNLSTIVKKMEVADHPIVFEHLAID